MTGQDALAEVAARTLAYFEQVNREVFAGDPVANPRLGVEILDPVTAVDTTVLVLITPWTLNGMAFPPDDGFPATLTVGGRTYRVFDNHLAELGAYRSVNLVGDVSTFANQAAARQVAHTLAAPFRDAVAAARTPAAPTPAADPGRADPGDADPGRADPVRRRLLMPWRTDEDR